MSSTLDAHPFAFDAAAMREMGYRVVDLLVERSISGGQEPLLRQVARDRLPGI